MARRGFAREDKVFEIAVPQKNEDTVIIEVGRHSSLRIALNPQGDL
jgi:hypothetical protein